MERYLWTQGEKLCYTTTVSVREEKKPICQRMGDRRQMTEDCKKAIEQADLVLVGIGTQFAADVAGIENKEEYQKILEETPAHCRAQMLQFLQYYELQEHPDQNVQSAYRRLAEILEGKNYFVVSLCKDDLIYECGLREDRIVTPCGGFRLLQCGVTEQNDGKEDGCAPCGGLREAGAAAEIVRKALKAGGRIDSSILPVCENCKEVLYFNQMGTPGYREEGYLEQWKIYTQWLQGCLNRNLAVLELGAGLQYPSVIRWPFEKIAFFNQKAKFFRVHSSLWQLTEELKERGCGIAEHPVEFLCEG